MRPGRDRGREVERDAPDPAAGVEDVQAGLQVGQEERKEGPGIPHPDVPLLDASLDDVALIFQVRITPAVQARRWRLLASWSKRATNSSFAVVARLSEACARSKL